MAGELHDFLRWMKRQTSANTSEEREFHGALIKLLEEYVYEKNTPVTLGGFQHPTGAFPGRDDDDF